MPAVVVRDFHDDVPHDIEVTMDHHHADENHHFHEEAIHPSKRTPETQSVTSSAENTNDDQLLGQMIKGGPTDKESVTDESSMTQSSMLTDPEAEGGTRRRRQRRHDSHKYNDEDDDDEDDAEEDSDDDDDDSSANTEELLAIAQIRLHQQHMQEEIKTLKELLLQKDEQIQQLAGQLRRATTTKCDLVNAFTDLEKQKEAAIASGSWEAHQVKKDALMQLEAKAEMERGFMNELASLMTKMSDMQRRHNNMILEKDFEIAKLQETLRRMQRAGSSVKSLRRR